MAGCILRRLRFDNAGRERIVRLVRCHDVPILPDRKSVKGLLSKHGEEITRQLIELGKADTLGRSALCRHRLELFDQAGAIVDEVLREESCFSLKDLAVNGHDMIRLGFSGREIGRVLRECLDAVLEERVPNEKTALLALAQEKQ